MSVDESPSAGELQESSPLLVKQTLVLFQSLNVQQLRLRLQTEGIPNETKMASNDFSDKVLWFGKQGSKNKDHAHCVLHGLCVN